MSQQLWTIDELSAQTALALASDQTDMPSGRVREVPDLRTIRYYTTLGLIDRPAQMRGRTALYGRRHLLQLVAIKRLQARGLSLAEVQQRLVGQSDAVLNRLARLPAAFKPGEPSTNDERPSSERAFWTETPAAPAEDAGAEEEATSFGWHGVPLEQGVLLLFEPARSLDDEDIEALRAAAAPLLKLLQTRRYTRPCTERKTP